MIASYAPLGRLSTGNGPLLGTAFLARYNRYAPAAATPTPAAAIATVLCSCWMCSRSMTTTLPRLQLWNSSSRTASWTHCQAVTHERYTVIVTVVEDLPYLLSVRTHNSSYCSCLPSIPPFDSMIPSILVLLFEGSRDLLFDWSILKCPQSLSFVLLHSFGPCLLSVLIVI